MGVPAKSESERADLEARNMAFFPGRVSAAATRVYLWAATAVLGLLLSLGPAAAQGPSANAPAEAKAAYDAAFQVMLRDPANLDKTFAYANAAIQVGDFEGAIGALERMLFIDPNLPRIRLELGVLYFRLGSFETARSYLQSVHDTPNIPREVHDRVEGFLAEIAKRQTPHKFSGSIFAGLRMQSNANTGNASGLARVQDLTATLDGTATQKHDNNAFVAIEGKHSYEISAGDADTWDSTISTYVSRQAAQKQVDVSLFELTSGPRISLDADSPYNPVVRPYALLSYVAVNDVRDYFAPGFGGTFSATLTPKLLAELTGEFRDRRFRDSFKSTTKTQRDGVELTGRARLTYIVTPEFTLNGGVGVVNQNTKAEFQGNTEYSITGGFSLSYPSQLKDLDPGFFQGPWTVLGSATRAYTGYDVPDDTVSSLEVRQDQDWRFSLTHVTPVTSDLAMIVTAARTIRTSSFSNFQYVNDSITVGANIRF